MFAGSWDWGEPERQLHSATARNAITSGRELPAERRLRDGICRQASVNVGVEFGRMWR